MTEFEDLQKDGDPAPQPGRFGRFYLQEPINSGGAAEIWVATDPAGKTFALRKMRNASRFNFSERRRFLRGCDALSKIHHNENVVNYIEHGKIDGALYLLMDYVEGSNLKQLMARGDPILAENVAQIIIDMAAGLQQVHESGFLHMDFKPENVLVTRAGGVRLVDFDLAIPRPLDGPKKMSSYPGTPAYMAPERLQHQALDERADIFAFGVTAYEVLTGSKPYPGETPEEILRRELGDPPPPLRDYNPDLPLPLEKSVLKCLRPNMDDRHPTMGVVSREVQAALYV